MNAAAVLILAFGLHNKVHALAFQFAGRGFDVIGPERHVHLAPRFHVLAHAKQHQAGVRAGDAKFDPPLLRAERLIGDQTETQLFRIEGQRSILIGDGNTGEFDSSDHPCITIVRKSNPDCKSTIIINTIFFMNYVPIDDYVLDVLLPDLTGHDRSPAAFLVYVVLWAGLYRSEDRSIAVSLQHLSERTGLSKSAVQRAIRLLERRGLIHITRTSPTAVAEYALIRHWLRRRTAKGI